MDNLIDEGCHGSLDHVEITYKCLLVKLGTPFHSDLPTFYRIGIIRCVFF